MAISSRRRRWFASMNWAMAANSAFSSVSSGAFRQRIVFFAERFTAHVIQGDGGVVAAETHRDGMEMTGFRHDGDRAAAAGGGLLIDFFDQPALQQLASNFGDAGGSKLAEFGNLNARDRALLVDQAVNCRAVKLFD